MENKNNSIFYAKAIGILLVVIAHVARGLFNAGVEMPPYYLLVDSIIYSFHMPLFFFLSGFFFYNSFKKRGGKIIISKIDTIVYPYILWSIIQGTIEVFLSNFTNDTVEYSEVFSLLWAPRAHFWFLYALFVIFILAVILFSILSPKATVGIFILSAFAYIYSLKMPDFFVLHYISQNFVFFVFGILFSIYFKIEKLSNLLIVCILGTIFLLGQFLFHRVLGLLYYQKGITSLFLALISILFILSLSSLASSRPNKFFIFIGSSSLEIYLMHILAGSGLRIILKNYFGIESFIIHLVLGSLFAIFAPLLAIIIIKKLKIPYMFSAPISNVMTFLSSKMLPKKQ
ncbi:MAG: acyltransferase [Spirochaetaceae bacterium]|nr:acyltransferase [Spirochaetaceae bacterium]